MFHRLLLAVRGWWRGGTVAASVALAAMSGVFIALGDGGGCDRSCLDQWVQDLEDITVNVFLRSQPDGQIGGDMAAGATGVRIGRSLIVEAKSVPVGAPIRVLWTPAEGATAVSFTPAPANPQGPPPYVFDSVPAKAAGDTTPSITAGYSVPAAAGPGNVLVDSVELTDPSGNHYAFAYAEGGSASALPEGSGESSATAAGTGDVAPAAALSRKAYLARTWLYGGDQPLTEESCQRWVDLLQSRKVFLAFRFPVAGQTSLLAGGQSYYLPMSLRAEAPAFPVLSFEHRTASTVPLPKLRLEFAPEWLSWAENHLPQAAGERWMTLAAPTSPRVVCTAGLNLAAGAWELYVGLPFDLGPGTGLSDRVVRVYACSEGTQPPPIFSEAPAAAPGWLEAAAKANATAVAAGPVPVRIPGELPGPKFAVGSGGLRQVLPPATVDLHFELTNKGDAVDATLAVAGSGAIPWRLYRGSATAPNTAQPITEAVTIGRSTVHVWAVADVPAGAAGLEVVTLSATNVAVPSENVWNTAILWLGELTPGTSSVWIPVASHAGGANQSQWRTDLGLLNPGAAQAAAQVTLHAGSTTRSQSFTVRAGEQLILTDIVGQLGFTGSGSLDIASDVPLKVSSRTYNLVATTSSCYPGGTFGQGYDAVVPSQGLAAEQSAWLNQLVETAAYRTNIALTNTGSNPATALVELYDGAGARLTSYPVSLQPGEWKQENRPFAVKAGQTNLSRGYAVVTVTAGSGVIATASLIDNATNDPTTMTMVKSGDGPATRLWIPVASHASGANQSQWRTDLGVFNGGAVAANLELRLYAGGSVKTSTASVAPFGQAIFADVVAQFSHTGSGAIELQASRPVVATSRTYNLVAAGATCYPSGTFGQEYRASKAGGGLGAGEFGWLPQLVETSAFRTNIAITNTGTSPATARVTLFDHLGARLAEYDVTLAAGEWKQENRPFWGKGGRNDIAAGYAKVTVLSGSGVVPVASVVDNATNDPTTMALIR